MESNLQNERCLFKFQVDSYEKEKGISSSFYNETCKKKRKKEKKTY